jgi:putative endonuclease
LVAANQTPLSFPRRRESSQVTDERKTYYVYILPSARNGTLYIGVTSNLGKRIWEHKIKAIYGFTKKFNVDRLVHFEAFDYVESAIRREKALKKWNRAWKLRLIEESNPDWEDLYERINW